MRPRGGAAPREATRSRRAPREPSRCPRTHRMELGCPSEAVAGRKVLHTQNLRRSVMAEQKEGWAERLRERKRLKRERTGDSPELAERHAEGWRGGQDAQTPAGSSERVASRATRGRTVSSMGVGTLSDRGPGGHAPQANPSVFEPTGSAARWTHRPSGPWQSVPGTGRLTLCDGRCYKNNVWAGAGLPSPGAQYVSRRLPGSRLSIYS